MSVALPRLLFDNRLLDATAVASSTAAGFDVLNLRDMRPYSFWRPTALPATVTVDGGSPKDVDAWAVYRHDLGSRGNTIELRASTDNFVGSNVLMDTFTPTSDAPMVRSISLASFRYWRLRILNGTAPTLAIALMGKAFVLPRRLQQGFDPTRRSAKAVSNVSGAGYPLGRVISHEEWEQTVAVRNIDAEWIRSTWIPAWKAHLRSEPFLFAWDSTDHPTEVHLVSAKGDYRTPTGAGSLVSLQFDVEGVAS